MLQTCYQMAAQSLMTLLSTSLSNINAPTTGLSWLAFKNTCMNNSLKLDSEGFLKNLSDWSPETADTLAKNEGINLTAPHWEVIHLVREFYQCFDHGPAMRPLVKLTAKKLGADKGHSIYLLKLFPGSPAKLASKIAGLPKPPNCL